MLVSFANDTIAVARPDLVDDHGQLVPNYKALAPDRTVTGCVVLPASSVQDLRNRITAATRWVVYAPYGTDVVGTDAVRYRGELYRVESEPEPWPSPTGALEHMVVLLIAWKDGAT